MGYSDDQQEEEVVTTVLVVGAGPVGLTAAVECLRSGLSVMTIDKLEAHEKTTWSKAFGIHARTMEAFLAMGIAPAILDQAYVSSKVSIRGRFTTVTEEFSMIQSRFKGVFLLSQRKTEDILEAQLELYGGEVQRGVELLSFSQQDKGTDTHSITARLRNIHTKKEWTVKCKYLIGADGSHSTVRHLLQLPFNGAPYPEDFVLLDAKIKIREGETRLLGPTMLMGSPFLAVFPIGGGLVRLVAKCDESFLPPAGGGGGADGGAAVSAETHTHTDGNGDGEGEESANNQNHTTTTTTNQTNNNTKKKEEVTVVDAITNAATEAAILSRFQALLLERCPEIEGLYDVDWASVFRIHRRVVPQYRVGKVFLMGDAAHIHSPVGGQGMNTGIHDAVNLAWKIGVVEKFGADPELVLSSYHDERHPVGEETLAITDRATNLLFFGGTFSLGGLVREVAFPLMTPFLNSSFFMKKMTTRMSMLNVNYRDSQSGLLQPHCSTDRQTHTHTHAFPAGSPEVGDRMPDGPLVRVTSGTTTGLLEVAVCRGLRHTLLLFGHTRRGETIVQPLASMLGGKEGEARLERFAQVLAMVHISRHFYVMPSTTSSWSSSSSTAAIGGEVDGGERDVHTHTPTHTPLRQMVEVMFDETDKVSEAFGLTPPEGKKKNGGGGSSVDDNDATHIAASRYLYLVRPDGVIGWRSAGWDFEPLFAYLETLFPGRRAGGEQSSSSSSSSNGSMAGVTEVAQ